MEHGSSRYPLDRLLLVVVVPASAVVYLTGGGLLRGGVLLVAGVLPIGAILIGLRVHGTADRLPWLLLTFGLSLLTVVNAIWFVESGIGGATSAESPLTLLLQVGGYLCVLAASILVVLRHAPHDRGGAIDAALIGLGIAAPIWEFILRPRLLDNGATLPAQAVVLAQVLVLLAVLGALFRISRTSERAQTVLRYLFTALACTVAGLMLSVATTDPETGRQLPYVGVFWIWGYLFLAAAGLHPSAAHFAVPDSARREPPGGIRLGYLGLVLLLNPIIGGVPQLLGQPPDGLLLCIGQVLAIPLVLTRIGQMMRQRALDQQLLVEQATHDDLTGLANRRHLFALVDDAVRRHVDGLGPAVTLLFCDLNDFKPVNDRWGHVAGDHVLRTVARRLSACVRSSDVVGRIGGDEFLVLCPGAGPAEATRLRDRITRVLAEPVAWDGASIHVGTAIGLAVSGPQTRSGDALIATADAEMYAHKRADRDGTASPRAPQQVRQADPHPDDRPRAPLPRAAAAVTDDRGGQAGERPGPTTR